MGDGNDPGCGAICHENVDPLLQELIEQGGKKLSVEVRETRPNDVVATLVPAQLLQTKAQLLQVRIGWSRRRQKSNANRTLKTLSECGTGGKQIAS